MRQHYTLTLALLCALLLSLGCKSTERQRRTLTVEEQMEAERLELQALQNHYIDKYGRIRDKVAEYFKVSPWAPADEFRPHVAKFLKLPKGSSWETILADKRVQLFLTEKRLQKFVKIFELPAGSGWLELGLHVEERFMCTRQ